MAEFIFLQFKDPQIDGESTEDKHKNWIELEAFSWGGTLPAMGSTQRSYVGQASSGRATVSDFVITKYWDKSSPSIVKNFYNGKQIQKVELQQLKKVGEKDLVFLKINFEDVRFTSYDLSSSGANGDHPHETITFSYRTINLDYKQLDKDGKEKGQAGFKIDLEKVQCT
jgi:type VI secretion system secreted protein Hcp